jgi:TolB protein
MSGPEERLRRALWDLAAEFPPYDTVPAGLVSRARRGRLITAMADIAVISLVVTGVVIGIRALARAGQHGAYRTPPVNQVTPRPTGHQIAFVRTPVFGGPTTAWSDVFVMNPDGTGVHRVLGNRRMAYQSPVWSPDGTRMALIANPDNAAAGEGTLAIAHGDGSHLRVLQTVTPASSPAWSPDGRQIAFTEGQGNAIVVVNADGSGWRQLVPARSARISGTVAEPSWSPDGRQVAFVSGSAEVGSIYVVDVRGGGLRRLTSRSAGDSFPAWSPGGQWIAFSRDSARGGIYLMRADGTHLRRVVSCVEPRCVWAIGPTWSPSGTAVAFVESIDGGRSQQIFVVTLATGRVRQLTWGPLDNVAPSWQPG